MAPKAGSQAAVQGESQDEKWVSVTWMPHTILSQTSHVCLCMRSAHVTLDTTASTIEALSSAKTIGSSDDNQSKEWKVRCSVHGIGGLSLVPLKSYTPAASVRSRKRPTCHATNNGNDDERKTTQIRREDTKESKIDSRLWRPSVLKATHDCWWDEFIELPIRWRDLPRDAYLHFEVLGLADNVVFQTAMPCFSRYGKLATGLQRLKLSSASLETNQNLGLWPLSRRNDREDDTIDYDDPVWEASRVLHTLERFEERGRATPTTERVSAFGEPESVPWLDALEKERAREVLADALSESSGQLLYDDSDAPPYLIIEFPVFDIPIMHEDTFYPTPQHGASGSVTPLDLSLYRKRAAEKHPSDNSSNNNDFDPLQLVPFLDYENEHDNPVEDKYRTLAHDLLRGLVDPALKPDREQRDRLAAIIDSPSHHPTREEKDLLWRFRFSLVDDRRALTKFLLAVDWTVESEVVQAAELLEQWRKRSPIEVTDALKLLGKHVAFQTNLVRAYAIDTLAAAPDSELRLYLLQLVQALKYENIEISDHQGIPSSNKRDSNANAPKETVAQDASLATFLINRAARNMQLANYLYWYLKVELQNPAHGARYREVFSSLKVRLSKAPFTLPSLHESHPPDDSRFKSIVDSVSKLGSSLRDHAVGERDRSAKKKAAKRSMWDVLVAQDHFVSGLMDIQQHCRDARGKKDDKEAQLRSLLSKEGYNQNPQRAPIPLPSAPHIFVNGVHPETAKMFKSALYPALIDFYVDSTFKTDGGKHNTGHRSRSLDKSKAPPIPRGEQSISSYKVIMKTGDDLRQDQLVIMLIQLMDRLLKRAALDLCLTPYSIIAMSPDSGLVEFVDGSMPISQVLATYSGSIMNFFQSVSPQKGAKYDIRPDVMSNYIRSCAGYCVITFLLGVGDRHLDNIMLRENGRFFHIDFGFIFGRDPKPLPPAFRLTREMVDGMGGVDSAEYRQFCSLACQAYNALRKSAGLVLNLLDLMSDSGIEDLSNNPSADAEGVIEKVEERFRLDLTDEQAERYFIGLITDALAAIAPRVMDVFHSFAVARR